MEALGLGRGKLLLLGEHAAVYGHPAVGLSLDKGIRASLELTGAERWSIRGVERKDRAAVLEVLTAYEQAVPDLRRRGRGRLTLSATLQRSLGFGSSAALCVALCTAVCTALGSASGRCEGPQSSERMWALAHEAERLFHGTPSGIDTGLALLGGLYAFQPRPPELPTARRLAGFPLELVIGAVPRSTNAGALIARLRERVLAGERPTRRRLGALGRLAADGIRILERGERWRVKQLGELCWKAGDVLGELGLATPDLERLLSEGRASGALGGKLSGAGGGGAFFLIYGDRPEALAGAERLRSVAEELGLESAGAIRAFHRETDAGAETEPC